MSMKINLPIVSGALLQAVLAAGVALQANGAPHYHIVELAGELQSNGYAISSNGIVAGISIYEISMEGGEWQAVKWDVNGVPTYLGNEPDGMSTDGYGINRDGDVVGGDQQKPILWTNGDTIVLDALAGPGQGGRAYDISDQGVIVGMSQSQDFSQFLATKWVNLQPVLLGALPGDRRSEAYGINESGLIVGYSGNSGADDYEACLWDGALMTGLGTLGGVESIAVDVNNLGTIVGWSELVGSNYAHAARWIDGEITALHEPPDTLRSFASGINDYKEIVGNCDSSFSTGFGALWIGDRLYDLNTLLADENPPHIPSTSDINNRGQITGWLSSSDTAFRLDPVFSLFDPEPGIAATTNTLRIFGSDEGHRIIFIYGFQDGSVGVPGCQGLTVDIRNPRLAGTAIANADGRAQVSGFVPAAARGRTTRLQAVDIDACVVTPVFDWIWE